MVYLIASDAAPIPLAMYTWPRGFLEDTAQKFIQFKQMEGIVSLLKPKLKHEGKMAKTFYSS